MESRSHFKSRWLKLSKHGRRFKPSVLVVVAVALCASVLVGDYRVVYEVLD